MERDAIELAARAAQAGDPRDGLAAVTALREQLEDLEAAHVAEALRAGSSWSEIAAALGVSRQAAHKRHASRVLAAAPRLRRTPRLIVCGTARAAVALARHEASRRGHRAIDTEHLLLGILGVPGRAPEALASLGVTLDAAAAQVDEFTPSTGFRERGVAAPRLPLTAAGRAALEQSMREAVAAGNRSLGPEHLLRALLRDDDSAAVRVLAGLGVSAEDVLAALRPVRAVA